MKTPKLFYILVILTVFFACSVSDDPSDTPPADESKVVTGKVEFYILKSFSKYPNSYLIDESSLTLSSEPILNYSDIVRYNPSTYTYHITKQGAVKLKSVKNPPVSGVPFAVMVNNSLAFTAYFWPAYSSFVCDALTVDPADAETKQTLTVRIPSSARPDFQQADQRNHPSLIEVLRNDKKLSE